VSRIPNVTARRIDRLAWRAHIFHRYAHHPLCEAYAGEVLRIGRMRVCKGCTLVGLGGCLGFLLGWLLPVLPLTLLITVSILGIGWIYVIFSSPWSRRLGKGVTRLLPALMVAGLGIQGLRAASVLGLCMLLGACLALPIAILAYRRRGPWRWPCESCPERELRPCSGFDPQYRRERAFQRLAGRWLASHPPILPWL